MSVLVFYLALSLGVWTGVEALQNGCVPTCANKTEGSLIADPTNCRKYYICLKDNDPSDFTMECSDGQLFDNVTFQCQPHDNATCGVCEPSCQFTCPKNITTPVLIADRKSCKNFIICTPAGDQLSTPCPENKPYFNGTSCTTNNAQCCDPCVSYCPEAYTEVPDPTNCTNFYFCNAKGYPDETNLFTCTEGYFDEVTGVCSTDAACIEPCGGDNRTTSNPLSTTSSLPTTTNEGPHCIDPFLCTKEGYFPKCDNRCDRHYYICSQNDIHSYVESVLCSNFRVINPDTMKCVPIEDCPYPIHI
ncbi:uncharacterized protein LOC121872522 [Homarus americanus]|uniref:Putative Chitin binding Peritrophin-A domain-containing protein 14 n=1 Tax=Homarus americanus TaxID=6706 RepID=A0A8J5JSQ6_HOMAM|nr:uncharacterized protein LOC121872522 [Homarus americanus]KAG7163637.1 putative Chitin binding Peritrophin-A domain-containing protein 14 [Homarus americanus]